MSIITDAKNILHKDPAARNLWEVVFLYPGFRILLIHRVAYWFYQHHMYFLARLISQRGRQKTGIEIHPGAKIGEKLFIDHGMGIVIGETAEIGENCTIYHQVTLGGTGKDEGKRHPTIGNNVLIGAGAKLLGPIHVGDNVRIAAGSVVLRDLPDNVTAAGVPAVIVRRNGERMNPSDDLNQLDIPDLLTAKLVAMERRIASLEYQPMTDSDAISY